MISYSLHLVQFTGFEDVDQISWQKKNLATVFPILEDTDNLNKNLDNGFTWGIVLHKYLVLTRGKVTADGEGAGNIFLQKSLPNILRKND